MKKLVSILVASIAFSVSAAEAPKAAASAPAASAPAKAASAASAPAPAASAAQKVCVDKLGKDGKPVMGKDGKPAQECKEMKVHKKLEGTKVPEKK
jgi:hypothetical protein